VFLHATSRDDKLWPEADWRALLERSVNAGFTVVLPWGSVEEQARSERIAKGVSGSVIPPRRSLPELASLLARAVWVIGVDTGLTHLAAALGTPTIAIFTATDPRLAGVARASPSARDLGGVGIVPSPQEVIRAIAPLLRAVPSCRWSSRARCIPRSARPRCPGCRFACGGAAVASRDTGATSASASDITGATSRARCTGFMRCRSARRGPPHRSFSGSPR